MLVRLSGQNGNGVVAGNWCHRFDERLEAVYFYSKEGRLRVRGAKDAEFSVNVDEETCRRELARPDSARPCEGVVGRRLEQNGRNKTTLLLFEDSASPRHLEEISRQVYVPYETHILCVVGGYGIVASDSDCPSGVGPGDVLVWGRLSRRCFPPFVRFVHPGEGDLLILSVSLVDPK